MLTAIVNAMVNATALVDGALIREALRHADLSIAKAAVWMEMDPRHLDRQLNGEGHLKHSSLCKLPVRFWQWYVVLLACRVGTPVEVKRAVPLTLALLTHRRMAKATMHTRRFLEARKEQIS